MARPVKVLHILHAFSHGGLENGIVNIINNSSPDVVHELCVLSSAGEFLDRLRKPIRCHELHKRPGNSAGIILQLSGVIRRSGADIVHTRNWGAFDGVMAACFHPHVTVLHGEHGRDMSDPQGLNRRRNLIRRAMSFRIRRFTTVSQDLAQWLTGIVGIPAGKVRVIPNGVDTGRYRPHRDPALRKELGIAPEEFVIGTIGRLDPVKNHAGLIRAFAMAAGKMPGARLVIVGDGPERDCLMTLIAGLEGVPPPVLTGYRPDIERFYGLFDVFVLNSFAEGMSNTLLEAMASGLPIICTPVGANSELVRDAEHGRHVPPGADSEVAQALVEYCIWKNLRDQHSAQARRRVETHYSLEVMISNYIRLYQDGD
jgi:sugar transferase (PEP-CTERM/EpsH1 system associated)